MYQAPPFELPFGEDTLTLDKHHDSFRFLQLLHHLLQAVSTNYLGTLCLIFQELIYLLCSAVVCTDHKSMIVHVQDEILAHDSQPNESNVGPSTVKYSSER